MSLAAEAPKSRTEFSRKHASGFRGENAVRVRVGAPWMRRGGRLAHQLGAELGARALQAIAQACVRGGEQRGVSLDAELDVATPVRMVDARQAEHLDAGEL